MKNFTIILLLSVGHLAFAQPYSVISDSLRLPVGIEFDAQDRLWVVEVGYGFNDGAVSIVNETDGSLMPVIVGLPSFFDTTTQENVGPWHTCQLPDQKFALTVGSTGQVLIFDMSGFIPGVSPPMTAANSIVTLDIAGFALSNGFLESDPYTVAEDGAGNLYIADAAANAIIRADTSGQLSVFATFPPTPNPLPFGPPFYDAVPTRILAKPGGGFYVCQLTGFPFIEGAAQVFNVDQNGVVTPYIGGLTMLTDMVNASDIGGGDLYVLELSRFDLNTFSFAPNSAKIYKLRKSNGLKYLVAEDFDIAAGMALKSTSARPYFTELASGRILRLDNILDSEAPNSALSEFSISPNPATDFVLIDYSLKNPSPVLFRVLDVQGRTVFTQNIGNREAGDHQISWRRNNQPAGIYWIDIQTNNGTKTTKLILN